VGEQCRLAAGRQHRSADARRVVGRLQLKNTYE
jgi:hypothetical protein